MSQVGGDGLFQEITNGILALRRGGGPRAAVAVSLRVAQIPAGSTDAVAWTLNGTRSVETATLRTALGDRLTTFFHQAECLELLFPALEFAICLIPWMSWTQDELLRDNYTPTRDCLSCWMALLQVEPGRHESGQWGCRVPPQRLLCIVRLHGGPSEAERGPQVGWLGAWFDCWLEAKRFPWNSCCYCTSRSGHTS